MQPTDSALSIPPTIAVLNVEWFPSKLHSPPYSTSTEPGMVPCGELLYLIKRFQQRPTATPMLHPYSALYHWTHMSSFLIQKGAWNFNQNGRTNDYLPAEILSEVPTNRVEISSINPAEYLSWEVTEEVELVTPCTLHCAKKEDFLEAGWNEGKEAKWNC